MQQEGSLLDSASEKILSAIVERDVIILEDPYVWMLGSKPPVWAVHMVLRGIATNVAIFARNTLKCREALRDCLKLLRNRATIVRNCNEAIEFMLRDGEVSCVIQAFPATKRRTVTQMADVYICYTDPDNAQHASFMAQTIIPVMQLTNVKTLFYVPKSRISERVFSDGFEKIVLVIDDDKENT